MTVSICTDNAMIDEDIKLFKQALSDNEELIGERLTVLARILKGINFK